MRFENKPIKRYEFKPGSKFVVTSTMKTEYEQDGFLFVNGLFSQEELDKLERQLKETELLRYAFQMGDGDGLQTKMVIWNNTGIDYSSMFGRAERVVDTVESLLGGEVYHYHTKINTKEAHTGGSFVWHQDYGYWYQNGLLFPEQMSVFIAIDRADTENGCLRVLRGSHRLGRIEHTIINGQTGADPERVKEIKKVLQEVDVVLNPGDAIFFHCNVLHTSDQNHSDRKRYCVIPCYNRADNDSYRDHHHARYFKIDKVKDEDVIKCDEFNDFTGKWFLDPAIDETTVAEKVDKEFND